MPEEEFMPTTPTTRRGFLAASALAGASLPLASLTPARALTPAGPDDPFPYEITRTEAEWRAMLNAEEFNVLREDGTEWPTTASYWEDYSEAEFYCRGCDLHIYSSEWRAPIEMGWIFFFHAVPDAVLTSVDKAADYSMGKNPKRTLIEVHCRRCGSHLGHILNADNMLVHCINGTSMVRIGETA
jgi:peptide-methionine (R)-S-oxide reductase